MELVSEPIEVEVEESHLNGELELELQNLQLQARTVESALQVQIGDLVTLTLCSENKKWNRSSLQLKVGANLFNRDLEQTLPGKQAGETYSVALYESSVQITVNSIQRTVIPELTDALICSLEIPGVSTLAQYRQKLREKYTAFYRESYLQWYAVQFLQQWCDTCQWAIDQEELDGFIERYLQNLQKEQDFHNMTIAENYVGEMENLARQDVTLYLQSALIECFIEGRDYRTDTPDVANRRAMEPIRNRVLRPLKAYLESWLHLTWKEEE